MRKLNFYYLVAGAFVTVLAGCNSTETATTTAKPDMVAATDNNPATPPIDTTSKDPASAVPADSTSFQALAASSDLMEIQTSTQAQTKAKNPEVKNFASQMITDHTMTAEELKAIASRKNMTLPNGPLPRHEKMIVRLSREKNAKEYDKEYMKMQVLAHIQAVELYEKASKRETDPDLKAFAAKHLPHLKMHLELAKKTKDLVN